MNCFRHCGVQLSLEETAGNPFADLEQVEGDVEELVQQIDSDMPLTTSEYVGADEDVSTCATFENSENWRQELRDMVVSNSPCSKMPAIAEDQEEESDDEPPVDAIITYDEAIKSSNDIMTFLTRKGEEQLSDSMFKIIQHLENKQKSAISTKINFRLHFVGYNYYILSGITRFAG